MLVESMAATNPQPGDMFWKEAPSHAYKQKARQTIKDVLIYFKTGEQMQDKL